MPYIQGLELKFFRFSLYMNALPLCMCVHLCVSLVPAEANGEVKSLRTRVTESCELLCGCWEWNLEPLQEQQMHLITEPSIQSEIQY